MGLLTPAFTTASCAIAAPGTISVPSLSKGEFKKLVTSSDEPETINQY